MDVCWNKNLLNLKIKWKNKKSICIVLCSNGYPNEDKNNILIKNIDNLRLNTYEFFYHAGTKLNKEKIYSNGGRVLNFVCLSDSIKEGRNKVIKLIKTLNWKNGFFRKDIGYKVID